MVLSVNEYSFYWELIIALRWSSFDNFGKISLGRQQISLGGAQRSLGGAQISLGGAQRSLGGAQRSLGRQQISLGLGYLSWIWGKLTKMSHRWVIKCFKAIL